VQSNALIRINSRREMRAVAINAVPAGNDAGRYGLELRRMREIAFGSIDRLQPRMIVLGRSRVRYGSAPIVGRIGLFCGRLRRKKSAESGTPS